MLSLVARQHREHLGDGREYFAYDDTDRDRQMTRMSPGGWLALRVNKGQAFVARQVQGRQALDVVTLRADSPRDHLSMYVSQALQGTWQLTTGHILYSVDGAPLWEIVQDDCGTNYAGGGYCSAPLNRIRYGDSDGDCRTNLMDALRTLGVDPSHLNPDACFNAFMRVDYETDGTWRIAESPATRGDTLILRALADQVVAVSNCPQSRGPTNGYRPEQMDVTITDDQPRDSTSPRSERRASGNV